MKELKTGLTQGLILFLTAILNFIAIIFLRT
jgi:hypothetical protein